MKAFLPLLLVLTLGAPPPAVNQSLPRSTPEAQGIASADILAFIEAADRDIDTMNSFMMVRNGHVVAEGWWAPYDAESPHILYSLTKSFTSTAVGMAIAEGRLSLHDEVLAFFPEDAPAEPDANLKAMRVHDLIRMATGHETEPSLFDSEEPWTKTFLAHPVPHRPGTHFLYNTPASHMLSAIIQKVTGMTTEAYLKPRLFEPLSIENPIWLKSPQGESIGGFGLSIRTEDIAKFGQLYLQKGLWNGRQLVPAEWVEAATSLQIANGSNPESDWNQGYGYQFWRSRYDTYRGDGAFGQYCIVIPEQNTVIAITSGVRDMQAVLDLVFEKLLPALRAAPLPENNRDHQALTDKLSSLTVKTVAGQATAAIAQGVSGNTYAFPENDRGLEAVTFDFDAEPASLSIRTARGEHRIPIGHGAWMKSRSPFANGLEWNAGMQADYAVAASGAWTSGDTYTVKLCLYETPFYSTMSFRFDGEELHFDSEHNVAFGGNTKTETLVGRSG